MRSMLSRIIDTARQIAPPSALRGSRWPHSYERQLSRSELRSRKHREFVGGMWDEIGKLQLAFVRQHGLSPCHRFLDIGCGALRGGVHLIRYLDPGNYFGVDMNASLIKAAENIEIVDAGLIDRTPHLIVDDSFTFSKFGTTFDFAIAVSVFTHMGINSIERCLVNLSSVLEPKGVFYATYFPSPALHHLQKIEHQAGIISNSDTDPFHYHFSVFEFLCTGLPLSVRNLGDWNHPRGQHMLEFTRDG